MGGAVPLWMAPERDRFGLDGLHLGVGAKANVAALEGEAGLFAVEGPGLGEQRRPLLDQFDHGAALGHVGELAGQLHPGGPCPHHGDALQGAPLVFQVGQQMLEPLHIGQAAEAEAVAVGPWHRKGVALGARGDHQPAIGEATARRGVELMAVGIDPLHPVLQPGQAAARQQAVVAGGDFPAAQFAAEQLVEQRQK